MLKVLRWVAVLAAITSFLLLPSSGNGVGGSRVKNQSGAELAQCPIEDQRRCQELGGTMNPKTCVCE